MPPVVSIIIPTLNEEFSIGQILDALQNFDENIEVIVVDGGSDDATLVIAEKYNVKILRVQRGRGRQLQAGANHATGEILWFLHADTVPAPDCVREMRRCLQNENVVGGNFTIRFDGERLAAKFLTRLYPNLRKIGLIYGDSAIFVRRDIYERIGGFASFPIFEDLDFI